jgi:hypothetical protein
VSRLGSATAFGAEAALWLAGAALIANAAGWHFDLQIPAPDAGSSPTATRVATASISPSAMSSPGASPTMSPIVKLYQAFVARPDLQMEATLSAIETGNVGGKAVEISITGKTSYKAGDDASYQTLRVNGIVTLSDSINIGAVSYSRVDGGAWTKSSRLASNIALDKLKFSPTLDLVDQGPEVKNGAELHRLAVRDTTAFSKAMLKTIAGATDAGYTYTVWVKNDGTPVVFKLAGWMQAPINGTSTRLQYTEETVVTATSEVTIAAPI